MHKGRMRRQVLPQALQTGLPPSILQQTKVAGGSLGGRVDPEFDMQWDLDDVEGPPWLQALIGELRKMQGLHGQRFINYAEDVTTTSSKVLTNSEERCYLFMQNIGAGDIFLAFGKSAKANAGPKIPADGFFEPILATTSSVHAIATAGSRRLIIVEGVYDRPW